MDKMLYLMRHAKSDWKTGAADFERPLNKRGMHDAPVMGKRLKRRDALPELIVCSPANRARQTLDLLIPEIEYPRNVVRFEESIYESSTGDLMNIVQSLDDRYASAMLIGHNPSMTWLASQLSGEHIENMPTCAVATIRLATPHWKKAGTCPAELLDMDYPKKMV